MKFVIGTWVVYFVTVNVVFGQGGLEVLSFISKTSSDNMTVMSVSDDGVGTITKTSTNSTHVAIITGDETNNTDTMAMKEE